MANIRCSLCNILPIQIKNLDDYLCEQDHVVCKKCLIVNAKKQLICPLCNSRIIKNRKILLETSQQNINEHDINDIPKIVNTLSNHNFSEGGNSAFTEEIRFWGNQCGILQSPIDSINSSYVYQNSENNNNSGNSGGGGGMNYHMGDVPSDVYGFDQTAKRCPADENMCFERLFLKNEIFDPNKDLVVDNDKLKIIPEFNGESCTENNINNAMLLYHKSVNGKNDPNFDPQKHFYQTMHYLHEKNELNRRPSLILGRKSSEKLNENSLNDTDSALVLKRFAECQKESGYNQSKVIPPPIITFTYNSVLNATDIPSDTIVQTIYERPKHNLTNNKNSSNETNESRQTNYNVSTKINHSPNTNHINNNFNNNINNKNINNMKNNNNNNVQNYTEKSPFNTVNVQQSTRTMLRNQIRQLTYSNIKDHDDASEKAGKFIAPNSTYKPSPLISLHIDKVNGDNDKSSFYTGILQHHLSKAMEDLLLNEQNSRNARREKRQQIVQQERDTIRTRIKDEIYKTINNPITNTNNTNNNNNDIKSNSNHSSNSSNTPKINVKVSCENLLMKNLPDKLDSDLLELPKDNDQNLENTFSNKGFRNISLSTESYPKLNPQLHVLSETLSNFDKNYSKLHEESFDEIKKQFEKQTKLELGLIAAIENKTNSKQILCETMSKNIIENQSNKEIFNKISNCQESKSQIFCNNINMSINPSNIIDFKKSQISDFCSNLNIETSTTNVQTLHEAPELRNIHMTNSMISTETSTDDININNNKSSVLLQNSQICNSIINSAISNQKFSRDNILYQKEIQNLAQNSEKIIEDNEINEIELNNNNNVNNVNNDDIKNFIEVLKLKNPTMTTNDIHDIIKFLPKTTTSQINQVIENLPIIKSNTISKNSSETIIDNITICSDVSDTNSSSNILMTTNNAWRAYYCPPKDFCCEPLPQLRSIKLTNHIIFTMEPKFAGQLNIERHPVNCPITSCKRQVFISEFTKHMKVDHTKTLIESISPGECRNLFLDPKVVHHGINKCHNLYLVTDKIRDLGSREYKNYLPIMLMSTKISLLELICSSFRPKDDEVKNCKQHYIVIWLTGLVANEVPIYYTLIVWSRNGLIPSCHIVHSGTLYSFRNEQTAKVLFKRGQAIILSKQNCDLLTDNGKNMVELQIIIH